MNETPRSPAEEAQDPSTSPERLMELTERHPQLHGLLVENPSCPDVARQWILATNPRVRAKQVAQQPGPAQQPDQEQRPDQQQEERQQPAPAADGDLEDTGDVLATRQLQRTDSTDPAPASSAPEGDDGPPTQAMAPSDAPAPLRSEPPHPAAADQQGQEPPTAPGGDPDAQSAWGLPPVADAPATAPALPPIKAPQEHPAAAPAASISTSSGTVRHVKPDGGVVPLGPAASAPSMPSPAQSASAPDQGYGYPAPAPTANFEEPVQAGAAYAGPAEYDEQDGHDDGGDEDSGRSRATWWACGGCLLLALIVALVAIFGLRSFFSGGDDESAQQTGASSSASKEPSEKPSESTSEKSTEAEDKSPAPDGAKDLSRVVSPTGNITCSLDDDSVGCSLDDRSFGGDSEDCSSGPFSIGIADGKADLKCGTTFGGDSPTTLAYDESATQGDTACRSESDGMTCWNVKTGHGFTVAKSAYETF
ncbi:hypothetical protein Bra3105_14850 [Brachybacterium halotolerans subsp. kimchii]|uniref:variant leucine-rich repeat-containing protein n=1 Tax=Brachybacterium halotolerans TaxID=2795215 RepID=UPI001E33A83C|nr:hypothetical protein [Brachybacterium halotolerans]UEJ82104.1 hypothetical protein Bra3105_14850 [Brachybacterium halotolerans subsp. kimchii]